MAGRKGVERFARPSGVCRRFAPRMNPHRLDRESSALPIKLAPLRLVEDRGFQPRSSPCKGDVLANELIPRNLAGTAGLTRCARPSGALRASVGAARLGSNQHFPLNRRTFCLELHAIGALRWLERCARPSGICQRCALRCEPSTRRTSTGRSTSELPVQIGAGARARSGVCKHCCLRHCPGYSHNPHC